MAFIKCQDDNILNLDNVCYTYIAKPEWLSGGDSAKYGEDAHQLRAVVNAYEDYCTIYTGSEKQCEWVRDSLAALAGALPLRRPPNDL